VSSGDPRASGFPPFQEKIMSATFQLERFAKVERAAAPALTSSPLHPTIGAEVEGIDLSKPISDGVRDEIKTGLLKWKVLFLRNQTVNRRQHLDFAKRFGSIYTPPYEKDRLVDVDGESGVHIIAADPRQKEFYESQRRPGIATTVITPTPTGASCRAGARCFAPSTCLLSAATRSGSTPARSTASSPKS
jgi:TfdA family taurine catabolism dioxygenase TauD